MKKINIYDIDCCIGVVYISKQVIRNVDIRFRNSNFPEIYAGVQDEIESINQDINEKFNIKRLPNGCIEREDYGYTHLLKSEYICEYVKQFRKDDVKLYLKLKWLESIRILYNNKQLFFHSEKIINSVLTNVTAHIINSVLTLIIGGIIGVVFCSKNNTENTKDKDNNDGNKTISKNLNIENNNEKANCIDSTKIFIEN